MNCPEQFWQLVEGRARLWWMMTTGVVQKERWCVLLLMQELTHTPNVGQFWWFCSDTHTHTHERRCLMGMLKCCSKWCCNFSCLQNSFRNVLFFLFFFSKVKEKKKIHHSCLPFHLLVWYELFLCYSRLLAGESDPNPKQLDFIAFLLPYQDSSISWTWIDPLESLKKIN